MTSSHKKGIMKALKLVASASWWCVTVLLALLLVNIFSAKMSGKVPSVFGYSVMNIVSGSMGEEIPQGSYILIKSVDPSELERDQIITFYSTDPMIYGMPNTHRIVKDPIIKDGKYYFVTKGDANPDVDPVIAEGDRVIGVLVQRLDWLTDFSESLKGNTLIFVFITLQILIIAMVSYTAVITAKKKTAVENGTENNPEDQPKE